LKSTPAVMDADDRPASSDTSAEATILVVDDEDDILDLLQYNLEREGYATVVARDGPEALKVTREVQPDLIVLDIMMPHLNGLEVCRRLRQDAHLRHIPILMLTAKSSDPDQIKGLDVGADVYVGKDVSMPVLMSQTQALLRGTRRNETPPDLLRIHGLEVDRDRYLVFQEQDGKRVEMRFPRKEFQLLYFLASHPGTVFTRQELLDHVWGQNVYVVDRTVDVHVRKIREKIGSHFIETVKGVGYKFKE